MPLPLYVALYTGIVILRSASRFAPFITVTHPSEASAPECKRLAEDKRREIAALRRKQINSGKRQFAGGVILG
jgi:hypothetical protein